MTMPYERTRAIIETRKFLEELRLGENTPPDIRKSAIWCLRHYPADQDVTAVGYAVMPGGLENPFGTSVNYEEHVANLEKARLGNPEGGN